MIETPEEILSHHADSAACDSFIAWRKRIKKPLTERAALMIAKTLSAINAGGGDATEALDLAQEHGWQTIKPEWYWRQKNGNEHSTAGHSRADTADRSIAFAAGFARTPDKSCF
jgi:hypothetical protein